MTATSSSLPSSMPALRRGRDDARDTAPAHRPVPATNVDARFASLSDVDATRLRARLERVVQRFAPVWPLEAFVAVNPFLGLADRPFEDAIAHLDRVRGARALPTRATWRAAWREGRLTPADLQAALDAMPPAHRPDGGQAALVAALDADAPAPLAAVPTVAAVLDAAAADDRSPLAGAHAALVTAEISKVCAAWFDRGQAAWRLDSDGASLYAAWRAAAIVDRTPAIRGLPGVGAAVAALPATPLEAIAATLGRIGGPDVLQDDLMERQLDDVAGWVAAARHRDWAAGLAGRAHEADTALQLLAIRLAWDGVLLALRGDLLAAAWPQALERAARVRLAAAPDATDSTASRALTVDLVWQAAHDHAARRALGERLRAHAVARRRAGSVPQTAPGIDAATEAAGAIAAVDGVVATDAAAASPRPAAQAVFCIDVRSEVLRRHLEAAWPATQTRGFAGFFGVAVALSGPDAAADEARCPALIAPSFRVEGEGPVATGPRAGASAPRPVGLGGFAQVEAAGWAAAAPLAAGRAAAAMVRGGGASDGSGSGSSDEVGRYRRLRVAAPVAERIELAAGLVTAMQLAGPHTVAAPLVMLCGHDSHVTNNPLAASLACGACGGRGGDVNARVAAKLLNDPAVRLGLRARGLALPDDTWFVAALHDTMTDRVTLLDADAEGGAVPASHAGVAARLADALARAGEAARAERAPRLGASVTRAARRGPRALLDALVRRARDGAEVRPEWGLAGNHAFIAAPRRLTRGLDLGGRVFLNDYEARADVDDRVLTLILTAPLVVASWINLQYYASTVAPERWGSGDKTLHNVTGAGTGVVLGNGGDLRTGLPWQSVHDGQRFVHEPLRLSAFVAAPREAIDRVVAGHAGLRDLLRHGWIHLTQLDEDGACTWRRTREGRWVREDDTHADRQPPIHD